MKKYFAQIAKILIYIFAVIGFVLVAGFIAMKLNLTKGTSIIDQKYDYSNTSRLLIASSSFPWLNSDEYPTLKEAMVKDQPTLLKVQNETGVPARLIASMLFVEQMRLYSSDRELFKTVFEPLQILGVQSQYSWGVLGLKQDTLIQIEQNLKTATSTFYLGPQYAHTLDFTTSDPDTERFNRVTDEHNQYYSYLYTALFIKEIEQQWKSAGFDISNRPEILATLYNIGFIHSQPNANPQVGGAQITIDGQTESFGGLAYEFYYSNELSDVFPK